MRFSRYLLPLLTVAAVLMAATVSVAAATRQLAPAMALLGLEVAEPGVHPPLDVESECSHCHAPRHESTLSGPCSDCHTTAGWNPARSHETTSMDQGMHRSLRCSQCHTDPLKVPKPACETCHRTVAHRSPRPCSECHTPKAWNVVEIKQPKEHVRLDRDHAKLQCPDCHVIERSTPDDPGCKECHKTHSKTFALKNGHSKVACVDCHISIDKAAGITSIGVKSPACANCHKPRHAGLADCGACHSTKFKGTRYDHERVWPLVGNHTRIACAKCHPDSQWKSADNATCSTCHKTRHTGLKDCERCHAPNGFAESKFAHDSVFPLGGAHRRIACGACHPDNDWGREAGSACVSCHKVQHGGLTACAKCHTTAAFKPSTFRHERNWKRTGAHAKLACSSCHPKNRYAETKGRTCVACHGTKHGRTDCDTCHTTLAWTPLKKYSHPRTYPLVGQHKFVDCRACHENLKFKGTARTCYACHSDLAHHGHTTCEPCHTPVDWKIILPHKET